MPGPMTAKEKIERDAFRDTFEIDPSVTRRYLLHNRTPKQIVIADRAQDGSESFGEIVVPPLAERVVVGARLAPFADQLQLLRQRHQLRVREYSRPRRGSRLPALAIWLTVGVLSVIVVHDLLKEGTLERREVLLTACAAGGLIVLVLVLAGVRERGRRANEEVADKEEGDIEFGVGGAFYDGNETYRRTKHIFTLVVVLTIGAVLPAVAIFVATDAKNFLVMNGGLDVVDGTESRLVGRVIQVTYTAVLSLFPAILYFQFDRHRVGTIRAEWVRAIFRMDRRMGTLADVNARYGDQLSEASTYSTDSVRLLGGRNSPIIVATLLISLGWTLLVVRTESFDFAGSSEVAALADVADEAADRANTALQSAQEGEADPVVAAATASEAREEATLASQQAEDLVEPGPAAEESSTASTTSDNAAPAERLEDDAAATAAAAATTALAESRIEQPFFQFLVPTPSAATMAFLGAYFFGIYLLLRSYFRGDLRPKLYNQITARLITVVVLAYLINTLFYEVGDRNRLVWAMAFLAGVVPTTVLQQIGHLVSSAFAVIRSRQPWLRRAFENTFATPRALTQVDGLDIYDSTLLQSEGISDVPALAEADLVSLMVRTRLPVERLIDWKDQAVLILLLDDDSDEDLDSRVRRLRRIGVRTASAILDVESGVMGGKCRAAADRVVSAPTAQRNGTPSATGDRTCLRSLARQIDREPSMRHILQWRKPEHDAVDQPCPKITVPPSGADASEPPDTASSRAA